MQLNVRRLLVTSAVVCGAAGTVAAQELTPLAAGTPAPDFTLVSSSRTGVGDSVSLHDFRGKTVVLAFFFRVRTKG